MKRWSQGKLDECRKQLAFLVLARWRRALVLVTLTLDSDSETHPIRKPLAGLRPAATTAVPSEVPGKLARLRPWCSESRTRTEVVKEAHPSRKCRRGD